MQHVKGKIVDKYQLKNGNIGLVVEDNYTPSRYCVEFRDGYKGPSIENLYGLLKDPFSEKTEHLGRLVEVGDSVELTLSYSKGPFREAYRLHSISGGSGYKKASKPYKIPYHLSKTAQPHHIQSDAGIGRRASAICFNIWPDRVWKDGLADPCRLYGQVQNPRNHEFFA